MKKLITLMLAILPLCSFGREPLKPSAILTPSDKIYGLSKLWEEAKYNFVFMEQVGHQKWDSTYRALIPRVMETEDDYRYYLLLERFCGMLNDGHTGIWYPGIDVDKLDEYPRDQVFIPVKYYNFEEGFVVPEVVAGLPTVTRVDKNLAQKIPLGSVITKVDGMSVQDYIDAYTAPYISQSADHMRYLYSVRRLASGIDGKKMQWEFVTHTGETGQIELTVSMKKKPLSADDYLSLHPIEEPVKLSRLKLLEGGTIGYVQLNSFNDSRIVEEFKQMLPELRRCKGLILDLTANGGGSTRNGVGILEYLTGDSILYGSYSRTRKHIPTYKASGQYTTEQDTVGNWRQTERYLAARDLLYQGLGKNVQPVSIPLSERIVVPTVILTSNWTASAAEDFLVYADNQQHMVRMGEKTFGSTGQPLTIELVGGIKGRICTKNDMFFDERPFIGVGILPHIEVIPSLEDSMSGRNVVLEAAIDHLKKEMAE